MGLDELTPMGPADVVEVEAGKALRRYSLEPLHLGIPRCDVADLAGGDGALNARILMEVFAGKRGARGAGGHHFLFLLYFALRCFVFLSSPFLSFPLL
jgi:anthranilate phosphoribosyltransferase